MISLDGSDEEMDYDLIDFKKQFAYLFSKHGISYIEANDKKACIGFAQEKSSTEENTFVFHYNSIGDALSIPMAYFDEDLKKVIGVDVYRGAFVSEFIEDIKPLFKYYNVKSITSSDGGLYSLKWDDGNKFVMENVDLEMLEQYV
jgi:hypothetical protein